MQLLTEEIKARLPKLYSTEEIPTKDKVAVAKFFFPAGRGTWYAVEGNYDEDAEDFIFFGYVVSPLGPDCDEWGNFSLKELESVEVRGLKMERDLYFKPTKLSELIKEIA